MVERPDLAKCVLHKDMIPELYCIVPMNSFIYEVHVEFKINGNVD
jgi:hypothetical protein